MRGNELDQLDAELKDFVASSSIDGYASLLSVPASKWRVKAALVLSLAVLLLLTFGLIGCEQSAQSAPPAGVLPSTSTVIVGTEKESSTSFLSVNSSRRIPLCDSTPVGEFCDLLNGFSSEHRPKTTSTTVDVDALAGHLSVQADFLLNLLRGVGLAVGEDHKLICRDLCVKIVLSFPKDTVPQYSDVGCYYKTGARWPTCDLQLSRDVLEQNPRVDWLREQAEKIIAAEEAHGNSKTTKINLATHSHDNNSNPRENWLISQGDVIREAEAAHAKNKTREKQEEFPSNLRETWLQEQGDRIREAEEAHLKEKNKKNGSWEGNWSMSKKEEELSKILDKVMAHGLGSLNTFELAQYAALQFGGFDTNSLKRFLANAFRIYPVHTNKVIGFSDEIRTASSPAHRRLIVEQHEAHWEGDVIEMGVRSQSMISLAYFSTNAQLLKKWFGSHISTVHRREIKRVLASMWRTFENVDYQYAGRCSCAHFENGCCTESSFTLAFVRQTTNTVQTYQDNKLVSTKVTHGSQHNEHSSEQIMHLCKTFFCQDDYTMYETLVHEAAHHQPALLTDGRPATYGEAAILRLTPASRIRIAETFALYVLDVAKNS